MGVRLFLELPGTVDFGEGEFPAVVEHGDTDGDFAYQWFFIDRVTVTKSIAV